MKSLIEELRETTTQALELKKIQTTIDNINKSEEDRLRNEEARAWAELKLLRVESLARKAAAEGKNRVAVANTKNDYGATVNSSNNNHGGWKTNGSGLKYWYLELMLTDRGLDVEVNFEHDGIGISSWYTMYIKW
jgi:hypothetical protein